MSSTAQIKKENKKATVGSSLKAGSGILSGLSGTGSRKGLSPEHKKQLIERRMKTALK